MRNRVLRARLGPPRLRLREAERRLLAETGKPLAESCWPRWRRLRRQRPSSGGTARASPRSTTGVVRGAPRAAIGSPREGETASGDGSRESDVGVHAASRRAYEPGLRPRTLHHPAHPQRARHRTGSAPREDDAVEDLPQGALGRHRGRGLFSAWRCSLAEAWCAIWCCSSSTSRPDAFTSPGSLPGPTELGWHRSLAISPMPSPGLSGALVTSSWTEILSTPRTTASQQETPTSRATSRPLGC
jgi:hypothetical protein